MKQEWDISAIKEPKYLSKRKLWEVYGILPKRDSNGKRKRLRKVFDTEEKAIAFRKDQQDEFSLNSNPSAPLALISSTKPLRTSILSLSAI